MKRRRGLVARLQRRDVAHLAAGQGLGLAVEMELGAGVGEDSRQRSTSAPIRFFITACECGSGEPSGRPQIARTSCSNWLVTQASMVQCPELCGRGASSLTSSSPSLVDEHLDREQPDEVERSAMARAIATARAASLGRQRRRRDGGVEDVVDVPVLDRRIGRACAVLAARDDHRDLAGEIDEALEDCQTRLPSARQAAARSVPAPIITWPLPS